MNVHCSKEWLSQGLEHSGTSLEIVTESAQRLVDAVLCLSTRTVGCRRGNCRCRRLCSPSALIIILDVSAGICASTRSLGHQERAPEGGRFITKCREHMLWIMDHSTSTSAIKWMLWLTIELSNNPITPLQLILFDPSDDFAAGTISSLWMTV